MFLDVCRSGNLEEIKENFVDDHNAIDILCERGDLHILRQFLSLAQDWEIEHLLIGAAKYGHEDILDFVIDWLDPLNSEMTIMTNHASGRTYEYLAANERFQKAIIFHFANACNSGRLEHVKHLIEVHRVDSVASGWLDSHNFPIKSQVIEMIETIKEKKALNQLGGNMPSAVIKL